MEQASTWTRRSAIPNWVSLTGSSSSSAAGSLGVLAKPTSRPFMWGHPFCAYLPESDMS